MTSGPASTSSEATDALAQVMTGLGRLAAVPSWQASETDLSAAVAGLDQVVRLAHAQTTRLLAEAGSRGLPAQQGHARWEHWLRAQVPTASPRAAALLARRAERLYASAVAAELAPTREAMLSARINPEQVDVVSQTIQALCPPSCPAEVVDADTMGEAQQVLLDCADSFDPSRLRTIAQRLRDRLDPDVDERLARDEAAREQARCMSMAADGAGMVHLSGALTPAAGAALSTALDAWSAPQPAADGTPDPRTAGQRRHDALQRLAESTVANPGLLPITHGSPYRITVAVPFETFASALDRAPLPVGSAPATLSNGTPSDGTPLSSVTLQTLACEAEVVPILIDDFGNPLDVADTQYAFTAKQRTAVSLRDAGCTWPGCQAPPAWCHVHHLVPFSRGGPTAVDNAGLLCRHHHQHVHRVGASASVHEGQVVWRLSPPPLPGAPPPRPSSTRADRALDAVIRRWRTRLQS
jgi:hypothetical protein